MEANNDVKKSKANLFVTHREEINGAYARAVREELIKHKKAGNSVVVSENGKIVTVKPEEIEVD